MSEPYRPVHERCEILAAELHDEGRIDRANLLWEAEALIRQLHEEVAALTRASFAGNAMAEASYHGSSRPRWQNDFRYSD